MSEERKGRRTAARTTDRNDKYRAIENMLRVLRSDEYKLLTNYMYLGADDLRVYVDITDAGEYVLTVRAVTDRFIDIGKALD